MGILKIHVLDCFSGAVSRENALSGEMCYSTLHSVMAAGMLINTEPKKQNQSSDLA